MEVGSIFHPSVRSQLITSILSLRWLGHLLGTFLQHNTRNQSDELSIFATVRESREARSCDRAGCESPTERRLFVSITETASRLLTTIIRKFLRRYGLYLIRIRCFDL